MLACSLGAAAAHADPPSTASPAWITDGYATTVAPSGRGTLYVGGRFHYMGPRTGASAELPVGGGEPLGSGIDGSVRAVASDGAGGWYVGGSFSSVRGVARQNLARIRSDGSVDPLWDPAPAGASVNALVVSGQTVYAGGSFTSVKGQPRKYLVALDQTGTPTSWNPSPNGAVNALALSGQTLYAGGSFTKAGETARNRLAAFPTDSIGLPTAWNPNASSTVNALAVSGSTVYVGGSFSSVGGQTRNRIAAVSASSGSPTSWNPNVSGPVVNALEVGSGVVYLGGEFSQVAGQQRYSLAAVSTSSGAVTSWNPTLTDVIDSPYLDQEVHSLELSAGTLYIGGDFYWLAGPQTLDDFVTQGQVRLNIGAVDASTGAVLGWELNAGGRVYALAASGGKLYAGGSFDSVGGAQRRYMAEVDIVTGRPTSWRPATIVASYTLWDIAVAGQAVYISGNFSSVGGQARSGLAALDASTGAVTGWNPTAGMKTKGGDVRTLAASGQTVYAGGNFWEIAGQPRAGLAAFSASTGALSSWNPNPRDSYGFEGSASALTLSGQTLYVGGYFATIGGQQRQNVAALDAVSGAATGWNPSANGGVRAIELAWPTVYLGGYFSEAGGQPRQGLAAVDAGSGAATSFNPGSDGSVDALALSGQTLYVGGYFQQVGGKARDGLASVDTIYGTTTSWNPSIGEINSLATYGDSVHVGGSYLEGYSQNGFALFASAPMSETPPVISGTPAVGQTLSASNGSWYGEVHSYRHQWLRDGQPIAGATGTSYPLGSADAGRAITATVTAYTLSSSASATSEPVSVGQAPVSTSPPRISGAPTAGRTLTASRGSWAGTRPFSYAYQWQRCETELSCAPIPGASEHRYVPSGEDVTKMLRVAVTTTNALGQASASSQVTAAVAPARSSTGGPLAVIVPSESPTGPVAGADPLAPAGSGQVAAVEQPDVMRKPVFASFFSPNGGAFAPHGDPDWYVSAAVGDGLVFVGSQRNNLVYALDAVTRAERYRSSAPGVRGIAYESGELYVVERPESGAEVGVYDAITGAPKRRLTMPLSAVEPLAKLWDVTGVGVSFGEVWLTFQGGPGGGGIMILDAQTGTLKAVSWHFGRYDCALDRQKFTLDPERCLDDASADTGVASPAWWDIATTPDLEGAFAGCRFTNRDLLLSALAADDVYVGDATLASDCAAGRYRDPDDVPREAPGPIDGMSAVPGMGWVLTMASDRSGHLGSYVREYDAGSALANLGAAELNLARSWRPRDHNSNNHRDVAYLNRDVRIDWHGELTDAVWQRRSRCLTYVVSDADIFLAGWRGEHWYELAREFVKLEVKIDGLLRDTLNQPSGQWCIDLDTIPSGVHELAFIATVDRGRQVSVTNAQLRVDHDVPRGRVDNPGRYLTATVKITGSMADDHAGPRDWQLQVQRLGGTGVEPCDPAMGPYECTWNTAETNGGTRRYPDGKYIPRAHLRDLVTEPRGGPNAITVEESFRPIVDNTPPTASLSGELKDRAAAGPLPDGRYPLQIDAADGQGSGVKSIEVLIDGTRKAHYEQPCADYACTLSRQFSFLNDDYTEGPHTIRVVVTDFVGFTTEQSFEVDSRNKPTLSVSGELKDGEDARGFHDGDDPQIVIDAADSGSGIAGADFIVDGVPRDSRSQACPQGGCGMRATFTFVPAQHADAPHTIAIRVRDAAGHSRESSWGIEVERVPPQPDVESAQSQGLDPESPTAFPSMDAYVASGGTVNTTDYLACERDGQPPSFPAFTLGANFEGLPLTAKLRRCDLPLPEEPIRAHFVSYIYGDCLVGVDENTDEEAAGCTPPLEIQSWPACERNLASYSEGPGLDGPVYDELTVRGAPAASFDEGQRLELFTGTTTVVLFGHDPAQILRAAQALAAEPGGGETLPLPLRGALSGSLTCLTALTSTVELAR